MLKNLSVFFYFPFKEHFLKLSQKHYFSLSNEAQSDVIFQNVQKIYTPNWRQQDQQ